MLVPKKKKHVANEKFFENEFFNMALLIKCFYSKIPDAIASKNNIFEKEDGTKYMNEHKRPYDGDLITSNFNYAIELKYNNGTLKEHQYKNGKIIHEINGGFFVVRKTDKTLDFYKKGLLPVNPLKYTVETYDGRKLYEFKRIDELLLWFSKERRDSRK